MGGITGRLYQQFAITIAISVAISSINALTLSPALASSLLLPPGEQKKSLLDGFFNGLGYGLVLLLIAIPRELLGMGSLLGYPVPFFAGPHWDKWIIMVMPPGAFFMLAVAVWVFRSLQPDVGKERP